MVLVLEGRLVTASAALAAAAGGTAERDSAAEGQVTLTGGPHLDPVVLMRLADDVLGPDAEAVVPGFSEDVGQVVSRAGHGHGVALPFLQREAFVLETPAQGQRRAVGRRQGTECERRTSLEGPGGRELQRPFRDSTPGLCLTSSGPENRMVPKRRLGIPTGRPANGTNEDAGGVLRGLSGGRGAGAGSERTSRLSTGVEGTGACGVVRPRTQKLEDAGPSAERRTRIPISLTSPGSSRSLSSSGSSEVGWVPRPGCLEGFLKGREDPVTWRLKTSDHHPVLPSPPPRAAASRSRACLAPAFLSAAGARARVARSPPVPYHLCHVREGPPH